jgi:threonine dehydratase
MSSLPTFADVQAAARRLEGVAIRTPLLENARVNDRLGGRLFLKAECLQRTGSFKIRGPAITPRVWPRPAACWA